MPLLEQYQDDDEREPDRARCREQGERDATEHPARRPATPWFDHLHQPGSEPARGSLRMRSDAGSGVATCLRPGHSGAHGM